MGSVRPITLDGSVTETSARLLTDDGEHLDEQLDMRGRQPIRGDD
jgi:hypothetical protein